MANYAFKLLYKFDTPVGTFYIGQSRDGRFHPIFGDDDLGSYASAGQAADDLAGGHTCSIVGADDTSVLGIPDSHLEWERMPGVGRQEHPPRSGTAQVCCYDGVIGATWPRTVALTIAG